MLNRVFFIVVFLSTCMAASGQEMLQGKIYDIQSDSILPGCRVRNLTKNITGQQSKEGTYSVRASEGDRIQFTIGGYTTVTVTVQYYMLNIGYDISMKPESVLLPGVTIDAYSIYRADSLANRANYAESFQKQPPVTGYNRPNEGVGISVSPITYLSSDAKQKRKLRKQLLEEEKQAYVDYCFPRAFIERVANIHSDTLDQFMRKYKPSYEFCKNRTKEDMLMYINDCLIKFNSEMKQEKTKG